MTPEQWRRVNDLYHAALATPVPHRDQFVRDQAAGDEVVARELQRLLEIDPEKTAAVDKPAANLGGFLSPVIAPGDHLANRYRILGEVGSGGMGQVYEAVDDELKTRVALKIIRPELANEPRVASRFKQEVQLARQVTHPNVCRAFDLIRVTHRERELLVLCMEFVDGETLSAKLRRDGKMKIAEAAPVIQQITAGLAAAHAAGVVHRDLKSGNIFLSKTRDGELRVVLADFGLAGNLAREEGATHQTASGWGVGTPAYMAPEQVEGGKIGPAADIYALGVVMYEMATGHVPYEGQTPLQVAVRRLREKPRPPRELDASIDGKWESAILRCLEVEPADRFAAADEVARALHQVRWLPRTPNRQWRRRIGAAAAVAIVAAAAGVYWGRARTPNVPPQALSWYDRGLSTLYDGNWQEAEKAFTQAITAAPSFGAAYARRAEALIEMDRIDDARAALLEGVDAGVFTPEQKLHYDAVRAYLNREMEKSEALLGQRSGMVKEGVIAKLDWARALMRRSHYGKAVQPYREIVAQDPGLVAAWIQLGRAYAADGKGKESDEAFEKASETLGRFPNPGAGKDLAYFRALASRMQGRANTIELAQAAVAAAQEPVDFRNIRARLFLAGTLRRADRAESSREVILAATEDARRHGLDLLAARGLHDLGFQLFTQRAFEEGFGLVREAIQLADRLGAPRTAGQARVDLAYYLAVGCRTDRMIEAQQLNKRVIDVANRSELLDLRIQAQQNEGQVRVCNGDLPGAELVAQAQLADAQRHPEKAYRVDALSQLATVSRLRLRLREARDRAEVAAQAACELDQRRQCRDLRLRVARSEYTWGHYDEALTRLAALEKDPAATKAERQEFARFRAGVLSEAGRSAEALRQLTELESELAGAKKPSSAMPLVRVSRCNVESESRRYAEAKVACGSILNDELASAGQKNVASAALAQAAYWNGDYRSAQTYADRVLQTAKVRRSPVEMWPALLARLAAAHRLKEPKSEFQARMEEFIRNLEQENGRADAGVFLRKRLNRELLEEIGYEFRN